MQSLLTNYKLQEMPFSLILAFFSALFNAVTLSSGLPVTVAYSHAHSIANTTRSASVNTTRLSSARNESTTAQMSVEVETVSSKTSSVEIVSYNDSTSTTQSSTHKLSCTHDEMMHVGCLNEGDCFVLELEIDHRMVACSCMSGWIGRRCELKELPIDWLTGASTAGLIVVVTIGVMAVFITIVIIWFQTSFEDLHPPSLDVQKRTHKAQLNPLQVTEVSTSLIGDHMGAQGSHAGSTNS